MKRNERRKKVTTSAEARRKAPLFTCRPVYKELCRDKNCGACDLWGRCIACGRVKDPDVCKECKPRPSAYMAGVEEQREEWKKRNREININFEAEGRRLTPLKVDPPEKDFHPVSRPLHYADKKIEVKDYIEDTVSAEGYEGYCIGNVIKYVSRYRKKNGVEDLKKARTYLDWAIGTLEDGG